MFKSLPMPPGQVEAVVKHKLILSAPVLGLTGATASLEAVPKQVLVFV